MTISKSAPLEICAHFAIVLLIFSIYYFANLHNTLNKLHNNSQAITYYQELLTQCRQHKKIHPFLPAITSEIDQPKRCLQNIFKTIKDSHLVLQQLLPDTDDDFNYRLRILGDYRSFLQLLHQWQTLQIPPLINTIHIQKDNVLRFELLMRACHV